MKTLIDFLPVILLGGWLIFSIYYIFFRARKSNGEKINKYIYASIPQVFPTIGILCTFIGIAYGLNKFDAKHPETLQDLMNGLKSAFYGSIGGVVLLIIFSKITAHIQKGYEKGKLTDETVALRELIELIKKQNSSVTELHSDESMALKELIELVKQQNSNIKELNNNFIFIDANNNQVKPGNVFRDLYNESIKQSKALQSFSTDLATTISVGFEKLIGQQHTLSSIPYLEKLHQEIKLLNNKQDKMAEEFRISMTAGFEKVVGQQDELNTIPHLETLTHKIEAFGSNQKESATEMTQNVAKDITNAISEMITEFKTSMSGAAKDEFQNLATLLANAGSILTEFPAKLQFMTDNLNQNFIGLQETVQTIAKQTLSQSEESTSVMNTGLEKMSETLSKNIGELQVGQEVLMEKHAQNMQVSQKLLDVFNHSIEKMNGLSKEISESMSNFNRVLVGMDSVTGELKRISENVNNSSGNFKDAQIKHDEHLEKYLITNGKIIEEIRDSLITAKNVADDYSQKFVIIEKGLQSIFEQIQVGLDKYNTTINTSLESNLGSYSKALNNTVESLAGQSKMHEEILDDLKDIVSKLNVRKN